MTRHTDPLTPEGHGKLTRLRAGIPGYGPRKFFKLMKMLVNYADTSPTELSITLFLLAYATFLAVGGSAHWNDTEFTYVYNSIGTTAWICLLYLLGFGGLLSLSSCYPVTGVSRAIRVISNLSTATVLTFMGIIRYIGNPTDSSSLAWLGMGLGAWWLFYRSERVYHAPK